MKRLLFLAAVVLGIGCAAFDYAKALDNCALSNVGDPAARAACQCDVSRQAGRSCDWIPEFSDGGAE